VVPENCAAVTAFLNGTSQNEWWQSGSALNLPGKPLEAVQKIAGIPSTA
jgi:hypothetical protein